MRARVIVQAGQRHIVELQVIDCFAFQSVLDAGQFGKLDVLVCYFVGEQGREACERVNVDGQRRELDLAGACSAAAGIRRGPARTEIEAIDLEPAFVGGIGRVAGDAVDLQEKV